MEYPFPGAFISADTGEKFRKLSPVPIKDQRNRSFCFRGIILKDTIYKMGKFVFVKGKHVISDHLICRSAEIDTLFVAAGIRCKCHLNHSFYSIYHGIYK